MAGELRAEPSWRVVELLSDVHLSPEMPATFDRWSATVRRSDADALFILGDLFEVWVGDDARSGAFESSCLAVLDEAARRRPIYFIAGNRDFLLGADAARAAGMTMLEDPTLLLAFGKRALLTHGDALCIHDAEYQRFRAQVRSAQWRRQFLALPLDERRAAARAMRDASTSRQRSLPPTSNTDVDGDEAARWMQAADATMLIHGHTHRPATHAMSDGRSRHVLSDWDFEAGAQRGDMLRVSADGVQRATPRVAV